MLSVAKIAPEARSRESALLLEGYLRKDGSRGVTGNVKGQGRTWEGFGKDSGRIQEQEIDWDFGKIVEDKRVTSIAVLQLYRSMTEYLAKFLIGLNVSVKFPTRVKILSPLGMGFSIGVLVRYYLKKIK